MTKRQSCCWVVIAFRLPAAQGEKFLSGIIDSGLLGPSGTAKEAEQFFHETAKKKGYRLNGYNIISSEHFFDEIEEVFVRRLSFELGDRGLEPDRVEKVMLMVREGLSFHRVFKMPLQPGADCRLQ